MPRGVKKEHLPSKVCETCERPFTWRKKWESCWDEVKTCSQRCKGERKAKLQRANRAERGVAEAEAGESPAVRRGGGRGDQRDSDE
mmetsp:Transcript_36620/g.114729  ORF Transcript_36620/g.114729 Transcript_36620/m.114729 type:complete len:86 (-) Transcript_36620:27-284(-)